MKHKHCDLIKAWADGAEVQHKTCKGVWRDIINPTWTMDDYRIKPKTIKYRLYLDRYSNVVLAIIGGDPLRHFVKWLGDWQEVEV